MAVLDKEFTRSKRYKRGLSLAILDIDNFKKINDKYGHIFGNQVLKMTATIIQDNVRNEDYVGRYGGDEFIMIFPESSLQQVKEVLIRVKQRLLGVKIDSSYIGQEKILDVKFSAGLACSFDGGHNPNSLINSVDIALYQAKNQGKDQIFVFNRES
jgi:diguanylate cyclase (GGDEF)-like protein